MEKCNGKANILNKTEKPIRRRNKVKKVYANFRALKLSTAIPLTPLGMLESFSYVPPFPQWLFTKMVIQTCYWEMRMLYTYLRENLKKLNPQTVKNIAKLQHCEKLSRQLFLEFLSIYLYYYFHLFFCVKLLGWHDFSLWSMTPARFQLYEYNFPLKCPPRWFAWLPSSVTGLVQGLLCSYGKKIQSWISKKMSC